ncbi:MAG: hypothetical protein GY906_16720, partial [bacterium]|nr:hypothetical protein [bacterium]
MAGGAILLRLMASLLSRYRSAPRDLRNALWATAFFGATGGIFMATLNNYLADVHGMDAKMRGWLEFPRELPGFLIMLVAGVMLTYMRETQMAAFAMAFSAIGALGLGFLSPSTAMVVVFVAIWSLGDHIIFAVEGPIGLNLAQGGREGHRLGQLGGARNLGTIVGVGVIFIVARNIGDNYMVFYALATVAAGFAAIYYLALRVGQDGAKSRRLVFKKRYSLFYAISALFGIRKQIFLA